MKIRASSKALIVHEGKLLLNRCRHEDGRIYYDLPGGGQEPLESMEEALIREVLEETGYSVRIKGFAGLAEEIFTDQELQKRYPDYCHRIIHLFRAELASCKQADTCETDWSMEDCVWVELDQLTTLSEIVPTSLREHLPALLYSNSPVYLGTVCYDWPEP